MTSWDPPSGWEWRGGLPGVHILYDHRFEAAGDDLTTITFAASLEGPLAGVARPVFARGYGRPIDRAVPRPQRRILTLCPGPAPGEAASSGAPASPTSAPRP